MKWYLWWKSIDKIILLVTFGLIGIGALLINVSTQSVALRIGIDYYSFINKQIFFLLTGVVLILFLSTLKPKGIKKFSILGLAFFLLCLLAVSFVGYETKGARRWLNLGGVSFQPSEFIKPFFCICNAIILSGSKLLFFGRIFQVTANYKILVSILIYLVIATLLILQPDFGMFLVLSFIWFMQVFIAGISYGLSSIFIGMVAGGSILSYLTLSHVRNRINLFFDTKEIGVKANYQVSKSLMAFKNGKLFGVGLGDGVVKRVLPDSHTDFIFAVAGEEFGAVFCILILLLFVLLLVRIIIFCMKNTDNFIVLSLVGLGSQVGIQSLINMGVALNLLPTKGMTLPLISYGGSSTLAISILFGFILSLNKNLVLHKYKLR